MIEAPTGRLPASAGGRRGSGARRRRRRYVWLTAAAGAVLVVLTYVPTIFVLSNSLKTGQRIFSSNVFSLFTQFDYHNYLTAWSGVSHNLLNTIIVAAVSIGIGLPASGRRMRSPSSGSAARTCCSSPTWRCCSYRGRSPSSRSS